MNSYAAKEKLEKKLEMIEMLAEECYELAGEHDISLEIEAANKGLYSNFWTSSSQQC